MNVKVKAVGLLFVLLTVVVVAWAVATQTNPVTWNVKSFVVYTDEACSSVLGNGDALEFGDVQDGTKTKIVYVKNVGTVQITINVAIDTGSMQAPEYDLIYGFPNGATVDVDSSIPVEFTLTIPITNPVMYNDISVSWSIA